MAQYYKVTTQSTGLNLRTAPDEKDASNYILSIPKDKVVEEAGSGVIQPVSGWKYISYNGKYGFASAKYLTPCDANGNITGEPDKTDAPDDETKSYKGILIAGAAVCIAGLALNFIL